mmetsp:Transcript_15852/g.32487  ORF Transcript_15852/g.32487 Transcript_15852/m.32487 type:complete len:235 (-) Transcript_15852:942-1646(-)
MPTAQAQADPETPQRASNLVVTLLLVETAPHGVSLGKPKERFEIKILSDPSSLVMDLDHNTFVAGFRIVIEHMDEQGRELLGDIVLVVRIAVAVAVIVGGQGLHDRWMGLHRCYHGVLQQLDQRVLEPCPHEGHRHVFEDRIGGTRTDHGIALFVRVTGAVFGVVGQSFRSNDKGKGRGHQIGSLAELGGFRYRRQNHGGHRGIDVDGTHYPPGRRWASNRARRTGVDTGLLVG